MTLARGGNEILRPCSRLRSWKHWTLGSNCDLGGREERGEGEWSLLLTRQAEVRLEAFVI